MEQRVEECKAGSDSETLQESVTAGQEEEEDEENGSVSTPPTGERTPATPMTTPGESNANPSGSNTTVGESETTTGEPMPTSEESNTNPSGSNTAVGESETTVEEPMSTIEESTENPSGSNTTAAVSETTTGKPMPTSEESNTNPSGSNTTVGESETTTGKPMPTSEESNTNPSGSNTTAGESETTVGEPMSTTRESTANPSESNTTVGESETTVGEPMSTTEEFNTNPSGSNTTAGESETTVGEPMSTTRESTANPSGSNTTVGESETTLNEPMPTTEESTANPSGSNITAGKPETTDGVEEKAKEELTVKPKPSEPKKKTDSKIWLVFTILVPFVGFVLCWAFCTHEEIPAAVCNSKERGNCHAYFMENIQRLKEKYPEQEADSWVMMYSAASVHVTSDASTLIRPVTLLVYSTIPDETDRKSQILGDIGDVYDTVLSSGNGKIILNGTELAGKDDDEVHKIIAGNFEEGFQSGKKVAVVHNFHLLPSCSVLAFHNYCNNEDAPYKDVAIILSVRGSIEPRKEPSPKHLEETVGAILHQRWRDCPEDLPPGKIDAVLSRIANNVLLLR